VRRWGYPESHGRRLVAVITAKAYIESNAERRTPNAERRTSNVERRTPNVERRMKEADSSG
jgi:hypothetical protein